MFEFTGLSLLKSTNPKLVFVRIYKLFCKTYNCFLKSQRFASSVLFNVTEIVNDLGVFKFD